MALDSAAERLVLHLACKAIAIPLDPTAEMQMPEIVWRGALCGLWPLLHAAIR